jgi:hypothetical protein
MVASISNESNELPRQIQEICGKAVIFQFRLTDYNFESCRPDYTVSKLFLLDKNISAMEIENDEKVCYLLISSVMVYSSYLLFFVIHIKNISIIIPIKRTYCRIITM